MLAGPAGAALSGRARSRKASSRWASTLSNQPPPNGVLHDLVAAPVDLGVETGQLVGRGPGAEPGEPVPVDPRPVPPLTVHPAIPLVVIDRRRLHPATFLLQTPQAQLPCRHEQLLFRL